jgi:hypothetical protein
MTDRTVETSPRLQARIAGGLYVTIIVLALFAPFPVAPSWLVRGDLSATLDKILASKSLYSLGGLAELIVYACDLAVALIFYELLKPVSRSLALLATFFRLAFVAIASTNVINHLAPLLFMSGAENLAAFKPDQLRTLALTFIRLHTIGFDISLVFFGFHCVIAGHLFFRSTFFPRVLGALLALAGLCYVMITFASFLSPAFASNLIRYTLVLGAGEILSALWLLVFGVNDQRWKDQAKAAGMRT